MDSNFANPFLFLTDLAWKIRVALPALILVGSLVFDFRWEIEINITTERIPLQDGEPRRDDAGDGGNGAGRRAPGALAIGHYVDPDHEDEDDDEEYTDDDDYEDEHDLYDDLFSSTFGDDDDEDDMDNDDDDDEQDADAAVDDDGDDDDEPNGGGAGGPGVNGTIRINRYAIVNIHNVRR